MGKKRSKWVKIGDSGSDSSLSDIQKGIESFISFQKTLEQYSKDRGLSVEQVLDAVVSSSSDRIPVSAFSNDLSGLETVVRYGRDILGRSNKQISILLQRTDKTISQAYRQSLKKLRVMHRPEESSYTIPFDIFASRSLSVLETIVWYLKSEYGLTLKVISTLLKRDERTIWTVYHRAQNKQKQKE